MSISFCRGGPSSPGGRTDDPHFVKKTTRFPALSGVAWSVWRAKFVLSLAWVLLCLGFSAHGQWLTQQIRLEPGFNAVYLQVTPAKNDCATVFGSVPGIKSVWMYNRYIQTSTFTASPAQSASSQDHWLMWFPGESPKNFLSTLSQVRGGQSYLITLASNAAPVTLKVVGIPGSPRIDWIPFDMVLAGFPVSETAKVTFYQFLKDSPEISTTPGTASALYSISPLTARETQIRNPDLTSITPGKAYWVRLGSHSDNPYPFRVQAPGENNSVQFFQDQHSTLLTLVNSVDSAAQTLHLRYIDSEEAPSGKPARAGSVPIAALVPGPDGTLIPRLLANGLDVTLAPSESRELRVGLAVAMLTPATDPQSTYQGFIEVTDSVHGYRQLVPVVAEVPGSQLKARNLTLMGAASKLHTTTAETTVSSEAVSAGLWLGSVKLSRVDQPGFATSTSSSVNNPYPASPATPLEVRALIHVNSNGVARLVQQVFFAQVSDGSNQVIRMYNSPATFPAGAVPKSRVSAPSWPGLPPTAMTGSFGTALTTVLSVPYDDRLNPFVHRYHPDHNNLTEDFKFKLAAGQESFDINRNVSFYFGDTLQTGVGTFAPALPALKFTGVPGQYIQTTGFSTTPTLTVQFWANIPSYQQNGATLLLLTNSVTKTSFDLSFQNNTGLLLLTVRNQAGSTGQVALTNAVPLGSWFNLTTTYDGRAAGIYINGSEVAYGNLPTLESGTWDAAWVGNRSTNSAASVSASLHDLVVRNGATSSAMVPQTLLVPEVVDPQGIILNLQGDAMTTNVVNKSVVVVAINSSGSALIDIASSPAVPLWTYGTAQGTYRETITGLRRQAITVGGTFQFTRISQDANLR